jgi:class 3 adenylate cyclase
VRDEESSDVADGEATSFRAFLIADLRGYTRYTDEHGDEAASALALSFAVIASEAVSALGGEVLNSVATRPCASSRPRARRCAEPWR